MASEGRPIPTPKPTAPAGLDVALRVSGAVFKPVSVPVRDEQAAPAFPQVTSAFLTPRVVDQRVFEDFGGQLRSLAAGADESAQRLREATHAAALGARVAQDAARRQQATLDALGALIKALDARAGEVTALIRRADERAAAAREAEASLEAAGVRLAADFERSLRARMESVALAGPEGGLPRLVDDAERAKDSLLGAVRRLERVGEGAERRVEMLQALSQKAEDGAKAATEEARAAERMLSERVAAADRAQANCIVRATEAADAAGALESLLGACARAEGSLREKVRDAEGTHERTTTISRQLANLVVRAHDTREELRAWTHTLEGLGENPKLPAALERIVEAFRSGLAQDISRMAGAIDLIARRAEPPAGPGREPEASSEIVTRTVEPVRRPAT